MAAVSLSRFSKLFRSLPSYLPLERYHLPYLLLARQPFLRSKFFHKFSQLARIPAIRLATDLQFATQHTTTTLKKVPLFWGCCCLLLLGVTLLMRREGACFYRVESQRVLQWSITRILGVCLSTLKSVVDVHVAMEKKYEASVHMGYPLC